MTTTQTTVAARTRLTLTNGTDTVTVALEEATRDDGEVFPVRFIVRGSSGYEAILPACYCEGRTPCPKPPEHSVGGKKSVNAWLSHSRDTCHEWHLPGRVETFASDVLKTYPRPRPQKSRGIQPTLFDLEGVSA